MAEFDDKLNSILGNPDAMAQIMQLAQSLGGGQSSPPPPQSGAPAGFPPSQTGYAAPPPPSQSQSPGANPLAALAGGMDPKLLSRLLPLIQELGGQQDSNARQLLYALRPYLREERQEKVERALQLARLFHIGKKFLAEWRG